MVSLPATLYAKPAVIGHRGSSATHAENSPAAFERAFACGAEAVELDVIPTADGVLAVTHDFETVEGLEVTQTAFGELSGIARLEDVLRLPGGVFDIEMKTRPGLGIADPEYAALVVRAIRNARIPGRCLVRSFDPALLREIHRLDPQLPLAAITANPFTNWVRFAEKAEASCISPHRRLVSARRVARAQQAGLYVMPWTANRPATWRKLLKAGVDGIVTDDPAALVDFLRRERGRMPGRWPAKT